MDIAGFLEQYSGLSELTQRAYSSTLSMLQRRLIALEPTDDDVREFLREFKIGTTLHRHKAAIRAYFTYKKRLWPFDRREFTPSHRRLPRYLERDKVEKLITATKNEHDKMFIKTLFLTALRIAEVMSLTEDNLETDGIRFVGKRDKERIVPILDKGFMHELRQYAKKCKGARLFPKKYFDYWLLLRRLCLEAGVESVSPHTLRHSRAVDLLNRGLSLGGVQTFLGHDQPATTLIYTQLTQRDLKRELEKIGG